MNWLKRIFCNQEEFVAHIADPVSRKDTFEVQEPKKNKNISEPVYATIKNMIKYPSRWKVYITKDIPTSCYFNTTYYTLKDVKTTEKFDMKTYWSAYDGTTEKSSTVPWLTPEEAKLIEDTATQIYQIKKKRLIRLKKYKESKERQRLMEIYK